VELPSQFNEHWAMESEVFANYARHFETGAAMPEELAAKIKQAKDFNRGYERAEVLAAAELDMQWHALDAGAALAEPAAFEREALERKGMALEAIPPRYRSSYFAHIWGGGYAAGYYAYLWSQVLDDRAYAWFEQHGGMTRANGDRLRAMVLSRGNTEDLGEMFERWLRGS
jgi:peptidyl-dipeptidase Dcp